ncbi:MAG: hypothetical protein C0397_09845 [Odoribacter sp.]|nr:hypothetical protein [Odoribacter sp.]
MRGLGDGTVTILVLQFEVVRKQFCQILAVIAIVFMDVIQEVNKPISEVYWIIRTKLTPIVSKDS